MYAGGRGNATARRYARAWAWALSRLPVGRRWVTLEVPGRRSGRPTLFPLGMSDVDGHWYLVSMLGECNWTRNVRAAGGRARLLRAGSSRQVILDEVPADQRAPIIKRYVEKVPGGRPHIPVDRHAPVEAFRSVAPRHPVFRVSEVTGPPTPSVGHPH